jgi:quercetin dioxygenase-like cupin family protein
VTTERQSERRVYRFEAAEWHVPVAPGTDPEAAAEAGRAGAARRFLAQGDGGFYTQVVKLPPGFEAPVHSHDHAEVFMVLEGSCEFDGQPMERFDLTVVEANQPYGFTAGPDGLSFLVVRQGAAAFAAQERAT